MKLTINDTLERIQIVLDAALGRHINLAYNGNEIEILDELTSEEEALIVEASKRLINEWIIARLAEKNIII